MCLLVTSVATVPALELHASRSRAAARAPVQEAAWVPGCRERT